MSMIAPRSHERIAHVHAALTALQLRAWSHAMTLRLAIVSGDAEVSWKTASGVLLELDATAAIATAWHVIQDLRALREAGHEVHLICDSMPIETPRILFLDETADIVLLEVPPAGRSGIRAVPYRPGPHWPPARVQVGDDVLLTGFPKLLRRDGDEILHGDFNLLTPVTSVGEDRYVLQIEWDRIIDAGRINLPKGQADYAGVSGGPVFLSDAGCNELVGIISQATPTLPLWRVAPLSRIPRPNHWTPEPV
ncbi:MAG: trypsin-like peptidase domain-containing protein [Gemmatimonadaceae bacterium]|nr:trypsin-like peptidase domain-containing protein [Gemmatimonadaceae bacterium]